ncbi:hypothetical protein [Vibrio coralliilyticus]|uniref:hypothetical protein n=1 Tax=Vibrio coralliilyticus TaxID=190893 RepID=UPI0006CDF091|nr:hypothetical protein [Vibrio coralliilyticus]AXN31998.1 hypothetical protein DVV14_12290 [Vibrio coralliilyticus]KPH25725.1 hypothetical protein ADU60_10805 [Vibrio coralliilyticus]
MTVKSISKFFSCLEEAEDSTFNNIRDLNDHPYPEARKKCLEFWEKFHPYADTKFLSQIQKHFGGGYWEMLLVNKMLEQNYFLSSKDNGPDICTYIDNNKVFIEAVCPNKGDGDNEVVLVSPNGAVQPLHEDPISLRLTSAFAQKNKAFKKYLRDGIVNDSDILIVAINAEDIPDVRIEDSYCPRIVKLAYAIGDAVLTKEIKTGSEFFSYQRREQIMNANLSPVGTNLFMRPENSHISAILYSYENVFNSGDYYLVHNPKAKIPLPAGSIKGVREFCLVSGSNGEYLKWQDY